MSRQGVVEGMQNMDEGPVNRDSHAAEGGYAEMVATFESSALPEPPIPERLRSEVYRIEEWCWATRPIDPMEMYMFREYPGEVLSGRAADYVAVSHAGHGANSYGISLHLVYGPLAVFVQTLWGGVYTDNDKQANELAALFRRVALLIEQADAAGGVGDLSDTLLVGSSDFRLAAYCGLVSNPLAEEDRRGWFERNRVEGFDPLSAAAGWLRALSRNSRVAQE